MRVGTIRARELMAKATLTVKVVGLRRAMFRLRIAAAIIRFAAWIGGVGVDVDFREF